MSSQMHSGVPSPTNEVNSKQTAKKVKGSGITCHQCRHKIEKPKDAAKCKNHKPTGKICTLSLCPPCLKNRYGEDAKEANDLPNWKCPKCRGNCNCSVCLRKKGLQPTGKQTKPAKIKDDSCVSDMPTATKDATSEKHVVGLESPKTLIPDVGDTAPELPSTNLNQVLQTPKEHMFGPECPHNLSSDVGPEKLTTDKTLQVDHALPKVTILTKVLDIELPPEDVGHALQFLEFSSVFKNVLGINAGEPEAVLQELLHEQNTHYEKIMQFHNKMLNFLCADASLKLDTTEATNLWLKSMWNSISEPILVPELMRLDVLRESNNLYENLGISEKFRILTFICDECLNTKEIRNYIDMEYSTFEESGKEARKQLSTVKAKMKNLNQELQNEKLLYDDMLGKETHDPVSIMRHQVSISETKHKLKQVEDDMIFAKGKVPKRKQRPESLRTNPIFIDSSGKRFWKLKCLSGEEAVLLQDVKPWDEANNDESWCKYGADQKREIENYISSSRRAKRSRTRNDAHTAGPSGNSENILKFRRKSMESVHIYH